MKFLKEEVIETSKNGVTVKFNQVSSSMQATLITMANNKTIVGRTSLASFIMANVITELTINGKQYDPIYVAQKSDLSDPETVDVYFLISSLVMDELILSDDTKKKSKPQGSPTEQEGFAEVAHVA